jgi:hypothetical protein
MNLPFDKNPDSKVMAQIYNKTVATYKFYWFVSLLDILVREQRRHISFWEIIVGMITEAWYPIHYFRLSFGKSDSFYDQIVEIQQVLNIPVNAKKDVIRDTIFNNLDTPRIKSILTVFRLNVPYRFLSPWIKYTTDPQVTSHSQSFTNNCLYAIKGTTIEINPQWERYLNENYQILRDFTFWNLTDFIQKRNPNVPDIPSKLIKPIVRESLLKHRNFWNAYIELRGSLTCIYTGKELFKKEYDLDHFIPWSCYTNDSIWNIIPSEHVANISKSDNLPMLDKYLKPFAITQHDVLKFSYSRNPNNIILEDYLTLHDSISDLIQLSESDFLKVLQKTFMPMVQIAENMGFKYWNNLSKI